LEFFNKNSLGDSFDSKNFFIILQYNFNYDIIINKLSSLNKGEADRLIKQFNKILIISNKIFILESLNNSDIQKTIDIYSIKEDIKELLRRTK